MSPYFKQTNKKTIYSLELESQLISREGTVKLLKITIWQ